MRRQAPWYALLALALMFGGLNCSQGSPTRRTNPPVTMDARMDSGGGSNDAATPDTRPASDVGNDAGPICPSTGCSDGIACNGVEYCDVFIGCRPGPPVNCNDDVACTIDGCMEPNGTCSHRAPDQDGDGAAVLGCLGGLDCNDQSPQIRPMAAEICDGIDNNCDGNIDPGCNSTSTYYRDQDGDGFGNRNMPLSATTMPTGYVLSNTDCNDNNPNVRPNADEVCDGIDNNCDMTMDNGSGMNCVSGSAPASCMTTCSTAGTRVCTMCMLGTCRAAQETCQNNCDDNGNGEVDEGCPPPSSNPPANDLPTAPTALPSNTGTMMMTLAGATQQGSGCGEAEVYVQVSLAQRSFVYLDTLDVLRDTMVAYRGSNCSSAPVACVDNACGSVGAQMLRVLDVGTHCFSISLATGASAGPVSLRWQVVTAGGGSNTVVTSPGPFTGTLANSPSRHQPNCATGLPTASEDGYGFALCPGVNSEIIGSTCGTGTTSDTFLSVTTGSSTLACNNDDANCTTPSNASRVSLNVSGPGFVLLLVDARYPVTGNYALTVMRTDT